MKKCKKNIVKCLVMILIVTGIMSVHKDTTLAASEMMVAYENYLVSHTFGDGNSEIFTKYTDLNADENNEMIIVYPAGRQYKLRFCTYIDGKVIVMNSKDIEVKSWGTVNGKDNQIFTQKANGTITIYNVSTKKLTRDSIYSSKKANGKLSYYKDNKKISKSSYSKKIKALKTIKAKRHNFNMSISKTKTKVYLGKTKELSVTGTIATIKWESRNKTVAIVDENGVVTGIEEGTAVIVAKIGKYKLYCDVTVEFDEETAKKNIEIKTWADYENGTLYVEMTNHNEFTVVVNGSGQYYDEHDELVDARAATGYTTLIPECTVGRTCDSDGKFYSYKFDFSLRRANERDIKDAIGSKNVIIESPKITADGVSAVIGNDYDEDLRISLICTWCKADGTLVSYQIEDGEVGYESSKEYNFNFSNINELNNSNLTCKIMIHWTVCDMDDDY